MKRAFIGLLAAAAACGGSIVSPLPAGDDGGPTMPGVDGGSAANDAASGADVGGDEDAGSGETSTVDAGWVPAQHAPLPQIPDQGGPLLTSPVLVTITYPNFQYEDAAKSFGDYVVSSKWIATVGADYGVGTGTHRHVVLGDAAPSAVASSDTESMLAAKIADGTLPGGVENKPTNYLYMIFYPSTTTMTDLDPAETCAATNDIGGAAWHDSVNGANQSFAYAVIPTCSKEGVPLVEVAASHELIEAMTDSYPLVTTAYQMPQTSSWYVTGEVGDLCEFMSPVVEDGHTLTRVWSNSAAAKSQSPCIPQPIDPFYDVSVSPDVVHSVAAGNQITLQVTGWSTQPVPDWTLEAYPAPYTFTPTAKLSGSTMNNGVAATLTVGVPAGTPSGSQGWVLLYSARGNQYTALWPVAITTP
jgi:hypothetical protein